MKNKKMLASLMALILALNCFSGCSKKNKKDIVINESTTIFSTDEDTEIGSTKTDLGVQKDSSKQEKVNLKIDGRNYELTEDKISHIVVDGDTLWDIGRDFNLSAEEIMKYNNLESDLIHSGDIIIIPMDIFKDMTKVTGIEISDDNGNVNWEVVSYFTDFALIEYADYTYENYLNSINKDTWKVTDDYYKDDNFEKNAK